MTAFNNHIAARDVPRLSQGEHSTRPPDWRWQAAIRVAERLKAKKRTWSVTDKVIFVTAKFIRLLEEAQGSDVPDAAYQNLAVYMPGVYWAWYWRTHSNPAQRSLLEAYILAGVPLDQAATQCDMSKATGECYAMIFFDVADRLNNKGFIMNEVFGPRVHGGRAAWRLPHHVEVGRLPEGLHFHRSIGAQPL
jgi:hypothetical protein